MRPTAHRFLAGHRIRLDVTSSDFPNYDRNHNTAANQNRDKELVVARQSILHDPAHLSRLILPVMRQESTVPHWAEGAVSVPPPKFIKEWGELGNLAGQLHSPIGIAIDALDRLYVTEFKNKRVQVFDTDGNSLATFAVPAEPGGIAVDKQNRVYVSSMTAHKVWVFDSNGSQIQEWGRSGAGDGEFNQPGGITISPDGEVYVVDQANHRIQQFTPDGKFVAKWGEFGSAAGQFGGDGPKGSRLSGPHFCAFDRDGRLYTTEGANLRIQRFDAGQAQAAWIGAGSDAGCFGGRPKDRANPFEGPIAIAIDAQGRAWVSSTNNRVQCFTADGKFVTGIGDEGNEPGKFIIPHGLVFDSKGFLYVVDASNQRIQKFQPN
jgi:DNA-binding beta-propeller fold protein YncE